MVRAGDNLWNISKTLFGTGEKWQELYKLNSELIGANPNLIFTGQQFSLPGSESIATATPTTETVASDQLPVQNSEAISANEATINNASEKVSSAAVNQAPTTPVSGDSAENVLLVLVALRLPLLKQIKLAATMLL